MFIPLILFFASLIGITVMIGKKVLLLRERPVLVAEDNFLIQLPELHEVRYIVIKRAKQAAYITLVLVFRFSIRTSKTLRRGLKKGRGFIEGLFKRYFGHHNAEVEQKEVSGFLKKISEYKKIVKEIKHKVKEEEDIESIK